MEIFCKTFTLLMLNTEIASFGTRASDCWAKAGVKSAVNNRVDSTFIGSIYAEIFNVISMFQKYEAQFDSKTFSQVCFEQNGNRLSFLREIVKLG